MLSFLYLNKIAGVTLDSIVIALEQIRGINANAVFSFVDDDLHTHEITCADCNKDVRADVDRLANFCLIKQINMRIDDEVNICFISNGESFTAIFTTPAIEMCIETTERLRLGLEQIKNPKALKLVEMLTQGCFISNGIYYTNMLKTA